MISKFLFVDFFFESRLFLYFEHKQLVYDLAYGLMPRFFRADDAEDKIIYDEDDEVSELYYMMKT